MRARTTVSSRRTTATGGGASSTRNVARDREKDAQLEEMGWIVVHVWEHEDPVEAADAIEQLWRSRRQLTTRRAERADPARDV